MNRCALCPDIHKCLPPDGPADSDYLFIGEAPGLQEESQGRIFVGNTSRELNDGYLPQAGLRRDRVRIINAIACLPPGAKGKLDSSKPKDLAMLQSCAETHLYPELESRDRKLIITMGVFAALAVDPDINLELQHGIPVQTKWGIVFPMYHPAQGLHEPKRMLMIRTDWIRLRKYIRGTLSLAEDQYPNPDYSEVVDPKELDFLDPTCPIACDTEFSRSKGPFCITYSQQPGTGRLIRADRKDLLLKFQYKIGVWEDIILFHNWLYDWNVTEDMGLVFPFKKIRDTMLRVFHLGNMAKGLKALAYRELGMAMQDFEDLVGPHSTLEVLRYYHDAQAISWPKPDPIMERDKNGRLKVKKPQGMNTKIKRFFTDYSKNLEKDVFKMWTDNWTDSQQMMEEECGPWPGMDIIHAPFDEVLWYACRDSQATLQINPLLEYAKEQCHAGKPQENWLS